jgi:hypothetical protein
MGQLSSKELRAIRFYCDGANAVPQLSAYPTMRFRDKASGQFFERTIGEVVVEYEQALKERAKERARERRSFRKLLEGEK